MFLYQYMTNKRKSITNTNNLDDVSNKQNKLNDNIFCNEDSHEFILVQTHIELKNNEFYKLHSDVLCTVDKHNYILKIRRRILDYAKKMCMETICKKDNYGNTIMNIYACFSIHAKPKKFCINPPISDSQREYMAVSSLPIFSTKNSDDMKSVEKIDSHNPFKNKD